MKLEDMEEAILQDALWDHIKEILKRKPTHVRNGMFRDLKILSQKCAQAFGINTDRIQREIDSIPKYNCGDPRCCPAPTTSDKEARR